MFNMVHFNIIVSPTVRTRLIQGEDRRDFSFSSRKGIFQSLEKKVVRIVFK